MVELKGSLGSVGLPAIVQLIGELHHSGNLELTSAAAHGLLGFDDGRLVAANYDDLAGIKALAACARELVHGDFLFVEGVPSGERTMDLGGSELQRLLDRLISGDVTSESLETPAVQIDGTAPHQTCPFLGFVDDATRHYARATALHRCYAADGPSLVTAQEQRDFCLSGQYASCPRFRHSPGSAAATAPAAEVVVARAAVPPSRPPVSPVSPSAMPAGVAARMEAASHMGLRNGTPTPAEPAWTAAPADQRPRSKTATQVVEFGPRPRRGLLPIALGAGLGVLVLVGVLVFVVLARSGGFAQQPANVAVQSEAAPTLSRAATSVASPITGPGVAAKPAPVSSPAAQAPTPIARSVPATAVPAKPVVVATAPPVVASVVPVPTGMSVPGQPLIAVQFASGPKPGWLNNPPYGAWRDGAYRLQAVQLKQFVAIGVPLESVPSDVAVSATFRKTGGPPGGGYGVIVRDQGSDPLDGVNQNVKAYVMATGDRGEFGMWRRDGDHWVDLVPWTPSDAVRSGGSPNDLEVRAIGDQLTFSVNGADLAAVQDATLPGGGVGVFVGGDDNAVALDRFVVQAPD